MGTIGVLFRRELASYFTTPISYVVLVVFLSSSGIVTFYPGDFFGRGQADLQAFFRFIPWLYLFLVPALTMRLWAEERKTGTVELLLTLPITTGQAVLGKYLAAWALTAIALAGTFPLWVTVNLLGDPDNGVVLAGYLGSLLMAGGFLAIGACVSVWTKSQVIAFVITALICLGFMLIGFPLVLDLFRPWAPQIILDAVSYFSFLSHFDGLSRGVIDLRDILYFASLIALWLFANAAFVEFKKAD